MKKLAPEESCKGKRLGESDIPAPDSPNYPNHTDRRIVVFFGTRPRPEPGRFMWSMKSKKGEDMFCYSCLPREGVTQLTRPDGSADPSAFERVEPEPEAVASAGGTTSSSASSSGDSSEKEVF